MAPLIGPWLLCRVPPTVSGVDLLLTDTTCGYSMRREATYVSTSVHGVDDRLSGRAGTICETVSNTLGRTRLAGHLEWRNADALTTAGEVCEQAGADARRSRQGRG